MLKNFKLFFSILYHEITWMNHVGKQKLYRMKWSNQGKRKRERKNVSRKDEKIRNLWKQHVTIFPYGTQSNCVCRIELLLFFFFIAVMQMMNEYLKWKDPLGHNYGQKENEIIQNILFFIDSTAIIVISVTHHRDTVNRKIKKPSSKTNERKKKIRSSGIWKIISTFQHGKCFETHSISNKKKMTKKL